jgi:hypothetical protein
LPEEIAMANGKSGWSDLWLKEDWWAVWIGLFFVALGLITAATGVDLISSGALTHSVRAVDLSMRIVAE